MIEFDKHADCRLCPLYESARNPGLPTRPLRDGQPIIRDKAVLFVGQSPGYQEDKAKKSFVGYTGQLLDRMVQTSKLNDYADIYVTNACRCHPPQGADEAQSQIRKCRDYLIADVTKLQEHYKEVVIMNLGAKACYSTLHISSLNDALKKQATHSKILPGGPRVFSTFHPAILHPLREPGKVRAVETHFALLIRYLRGEFIPNELTIVPEVLADIPDKLPDKVSLDIETYGILAGVEQTVFHPVKSKDIDGVDYKYQIETVSFGWEEDGRIRTALYMFNFKAHRRKIREWFRRMSRDKITCIGQNIKFDLMYLYFSGDQEIPYWIDPRRLKIDDVLLMGFLFYEQQPEKGLKEQAILYGISDYSANKVTGKQGNAKSCWDKDLHIYNCKDAAVALCLYNDYVRMIEEKYGKDSPKLSDTCAWIRNAILWDTFMLEKNGSCFDISKIYKYHTEESNKCQQLLESAEANYGIKFAGTGSDAPLRQLMLDCLTEANLLSDSRVIWTGKEKKIGIGVENVNLVKEHLIKSSRSYSVISDFQEYKERAKIVTTYTKPLLEDKRKGIVLFAGRVGHVFPSWYPVPLYADRGGDSNDKAGGQIQGRFSCKKPARQTEPKRIQECSRSRWSNGQIIEYDIASDHLRMAALLSGDPLLVDAFTKKGMSLHLMTAETLFPSIFCPDFKEKYLKEYKVSKNLNFLVLFKGGATAFQTEAREKVGLELGIEFCQDAINKWYAKHRVYKEWQDNMIDLAARQGYLVLPTGWSRTFGIGHANIAGQMGEVCNFLHQTPCAQLIHSAQYAIQLDFLKYHIRSLICHQKHDALFIDTYPAEGETVDEIVDRYLTRPPLMPVFERWTGRTIPWSYERQRCGV